MIYAARVVRLFEAFAPAASLRPRGAGRSASDGGVRIRWLGTAGFTIEVANGAVAIDPYLTRASLGTLATRRLRPDAQALAAHMPARLQAVLCGHSHFDHALDAPSLARLSGARLVGSKTTIAFGRASLLDERALTEIPASGGSVALADFDVEFVPSLHARILLGEVPFRGELDALPALPARIWEYRMGGAYGVFVRSAGVSVYHNGSADLIDAALEGKRADVLLVGLAGRAVTPDYLSRLLNLLRPKVVVPAHHDAMFEPLERGVRLLPGVDFPGFVRDVRRILPSAQVVAPLYGESLFVARAASDAYLDS
ncbi:MAG: MBL fold metallo-hydrolase [Polyangiaceae bacterium]